MTSIVGSSSSSAFGLKFEIAQIAQCGNTALQHGGEPVLRHKLCLCHFAVERKGSRRGLPVRNRFPAALQKGRFPASLRVLLRWKGRFPRSSPLARPLHSVGYLLPSPHRSPLPSARTPDPVRDKRGRFSSREVSSSAIAEGSTVPSSAGCVSSGNARWALMSNSTAGTAGGSSVIGATTLAALVKPRFSQSEIALEQRLPSDLFPGHLP